MPSKLFSIVIPIVAPHDKFLLSLLRRFRTESQLIGEVIIVRSGMNSFLGHFYKAWFLFIPKIFLRIRIKVFTSPIHRTAGQNRNLGWANSEFPYTAFLDADDVYHEFRLLTIRELITLHPNANLILNKYQYSKLDNHYRKLEAGEILDISHISGCDLSADSIRANSHIPGAFNISVLDRFKNALDVPQGHVVVKTALRNQVKYSDLLKGEDGLFCNEILQKFGEVFVINRELSQYRNQFSSFSSSYLTKILVNIKHCLFG